MSLLTFLFFFNDTAPTEIYTLSLHDALPIFWNAIEQWVTEYLAIYYPNNGALQADTELQAWWKERSEEHTSELQSHSDLVCRLLLEKKKERARGIVLLTP